MFIFFFLLCFFNLEASHIHRLFDSDGLQRYEIVERKGRHQIVLNGESINFGDYVLIAPSKIIQFSRVLGAGQRTLVFEDENGRAYRLNRSTGPKFRLAFDGFLQTHRKLKALLPSKRLVDLVQGAPLGRDLVEVENLKISFLLSDYLNLGAKRFAEADEDLVNFLVDFKEVGALSDFHSRQIGWVQNRGWVLFDLGVMVLLKPLRADYDLLVHTREWVVGVNDFDDGYLQELESRVLKEQIQLNAALTCKKIL